MSQCSAALFVFCTTTNAFGVSSEWSWCDKTVLCVCLVWRLLHHMLAMCCSRVVQLLGHTRLLFVPELSRAGLLLVAIS